MAIKILGVGPGIAGYIKIGQPTPKDGPRKGAPEKFDHIEITSRARNENGQLEIDGALMDALVEAAEQEGSSIKLCGGCERSKTLGYGNGLPTTLGVFLANDDPEIAFPNRLAWYRGRHVYCSGDGVEAQRRKELKSQEGVKFGDPAPHSPCGNECLDFIEGRCKPDARLRCSLAAKELVGAVYEFRTTSWNSIRNIDSCMKQVLGITRGTMSWVPLVFSLGQQVVQPRNGPANKAMVATLFFPGSAAMLLREAASVHQQMGEFGRQLLEARAGLPGGGDAWQDPPEEVAGHAAEFQPEERDVDAIELPGRQASEDAPGATIALSPAGSTQEAAEKGTAPAVCGMKLPGGRICTRDPAHVGKHSAKRKLEPQPDQAEPGTGTQEPEDAQEDPPEDQGTQEDQGDPEGRFSADLGANLTYWQIAEMKRLLREQGKSSANAAKIFLGSQLAREITTMADLTEGDFRTVLSSLDGALFETLYQLEIF